MADDILSAGLDISGFSPEKKKTLQEFIALFDKLEKYDQKKFTPLSGDGLSQFNASLRETDRLMASINSQMANMKIPKQSVSSTKETVDAVKDVKKEVENTNTSLDRMGKSLNRVWSVLRYVAYILPGLGIAGIFNVLIDAIGSAITSLGIFEGGLEKVLKIQLAINKTQEQFIKLQKESEELMKTRLGDVQAAENELKYHIALNKTKKDRLDLEYKLLELEAKKANKKFISEGGFETFGKAQSELDQALRALNYARQQVQKSESGKKGQDDINPFGTMEEERLQALELAQIQYNIAKENFQRIKGIVEDNANFMQKLNSKQLEIQEFAREENRKKELSNAEKTYAITVSNNKKILDDDRSMLDERLKAIKSNYEAERALADAQLKYKLTQANAYNADGTATSETADAINQANQKKKDATNKYLTSVHKITESYRQRDLTAQEKIDKDKFESEAQTNERIFRDDNQSLEKRIASYIKYIDSKSRIQEIEYNREKDREGLTAKELEALEVNRTEQIKQLKANGAKQMYEIVSSWGKKQLDYVEDTNAAQVQSDKSLYTQQVRLLNESFDKREISYLQYIQRKKAIDAKFRPDSIENEIQNDRQVIKRLKEFQKEQLDLRDKFAGEANLLVGKDGFKEAEAKVNAIEDLLKIVGVDLARAERDLAEDEYKYEEVKYNRLLALYKEFEENKKRIRESGFQFAETLIENLFQKEQTKLERQGQIYNEQADVQKEALDRSSLNEKNKTAYSIQLEQQKIEFNKRQSLEERKLRREQAMFEQKLALARIAWNTQIAISSHLGFPPLILQDVIMGALAAATVLANTIPAYEDGTKGKPHPGGPARIGEKGKLEMVKEPGKAPYFVNQDQITNLPKGTEVFPMSDTPIISKNGDSSNWEQTMMIVSAIRKQKKEIKNIIKPVTKIDMGWEVYKNRIING